MSSTTPSTKRIYNWDAHDHLRNHLHTLDLYEMVLKRGGRLTQGNQKIVEAFNKEATPLKNIPAEEALANQTWQMGRIVRLVNRHAAMSMDRANNINQYLEEMQQWCWSPEWADELKDEATARKDDLEGLQCALNGAGPVFSESEIRQTNSMQPWLRGLVEIQAALQYHHTLSSRKPTSSPYDGATERMISRKISTRQYDMAIEILDHVHVMRRLSEECLVMASTISDMPKKPRERLNERFQSLCAVACHTTISADIELDRAAALCANSYRTRDMSCVVLGAGPR